MTGAGVALRRARLVLARTPYDSFRQQLENIVHGVPHIWVGRTMATGSSPNDPVF